jgi:hypothetical protein
MTLRIRMTARCENEIVTLRGGVCLVVIRKPKSHHGDTEARRIAGPESRRRFPQMNADWKQCREKSKTLNHRGHEGTRRKSEIGNQNLTTDARSRPEHRESQQIPVLTLSFNAVPIWDC